MRECLQLTLVLSPSDVCSCFAWSDGEAWLALRISLDSCILSLSLVAGMLVAPYGRWIGEPKPLVEHGRISSGLQKTESKGIAQHGRADGLVANPACWLSRMNI